jgi:hypothetical protein
MYKPEDLRPGLVAPFISTLRDKKRLDSSETAGNLNLGVS